MKSFYLFLFVFILPGCSKKDEVIIPPQVIDVQLLKKVIHIDAQFPANSYEKHYTYDHQNRITSIQSYDQNNYLKSESVFQYIQDTIKEFNYLHSVLESYSVEYPTLQYLTSRKDLYGKTRLKPNVDPDSITYLGYQLRMKNSCSKLTRMENYTWDNNTLTSYETIEYTDDNDSYKQRKFLNDNSLFYRIEVTKNNKIAEYNTHSDGNCCHRSSTQIKSWDQNNVNDYSQSISYEYDSKSYPKFAIKTLASGASKRYDYEYY